MYFGRDCLGRRSLLWHKSDQGESTVGLPFILTSTGYSAFRSELLRLEEVPADGIYSLSLASNSPKVVTKHPWIPAQSSSANEPGTMVRLSHPYAMIMLLDNAFLIFLTLHHRHYVDIAIRESE